MALKTCECLFKNGGKNLPGFMVGRQMTVTLCFFVIARVTTINVGEGEENIFGVNNTLQNFFNTGFLGAIITTILGSISWQLVAGAFPIAFLSNPIVYIFLQLALFLEATGICAAAWFLAMIQKKVMGFQYDEVYVGTPEERAAKGHGDAEGKLDMATFAPPHKVGEHKVDQRYIDLVASNFATQRKNILKNISDLRDQVKEADTEEEKAIFQEALKLEIANLKKLNTNESASMRSLNAMKDDLELAEEGKTV
jgi:hypothetical protein